MSTSSSAPTIFCLFTCHLRSVHLWSSVCSFALNGLSNLSNIKSKKGRKIFLFFDFLMKQTFGKACLWCLSVCVLVVVFCLLVVVVVLVCLSVGVLLLLLLLCVCVCVCACVRACVRA